MAGRKIYWHQVKHHWEIYLLVLPALVMIGMFVYYPALNGVIHSFFRWNAADISEFNWGRNYVDLAQSSEFWSSFQLAFLLGFFNILKMISALSAAVLIHRCRSARIQFFYRIAFVAPMIVPGIVTVLVWRTLFFDPTNGLLNKFLITSGGLDFLVTLDNIFHWELFTIDAMPAWLGHPKLVIVAVILWGLPWVGGFALLTHLAKLQGIEKSIYEAAEIDGVNWWTKFTQVEFPSMMGSIYIALVFMIISSIRDGGMILALAGIEGGPGGRATVPALFMIRKAFLDQMMGYACAVGIVLTLIIMLLQKSSSYVMNWKEHPKPAQRRFRIIAALVGILMIVMANTLKFVPHGAATMGSLIILACIAGEPWNLIYMRTFKHKLEYIRALLIIPGVYLIGFAEVNSIFIKAFGILLILAAIPSGYVFTYLADKYKEFRAWLADQMSIDPDVQYQQSMERQEQPLYRALRTFETVFLRFLKHFFIWFILLLALLPLYMMIVVSFKSNTQFYDNPVVPDFLLPKTQKEEMVASLVDEGAIKKTVDIRQGAFYVDVYSDMYEIVDKARVQEAAKTLKEESDGKFVLLKMNGEIKKNDLKDRRLYRQNWRNGWETMKGNVANSVFISTLGVALALALALFASYFFVRLTMPLSGFFWNAILVLMMMPSIANLVPLFILLRDLGMLNTLTALILVQASEGLVGSIFVFRNFVDDIPGALFEAAEMDGANHFQQLANVVFPLSGPIIGTVGIQQFVHQWNSFLIPLIVMREQEKLPITVQLHRMSGEYFKVWGPLMSGYLIASIPLFVLFVLTMRLFIRGLTEGSVK